MPSKSKRRAILHMLENLVAKDFRRFGVELRNRTEEPRVPRSRVEGKDCLDITDVLVSTFTEDGAVREAERILRDLNLNDEADHLGEMKIHLIGVSGYGTPGCMNQIEAGSLFG